MDSTANRILLGRYDLRGLIGKGGMGEVHKAFDRKTGGLVAVKICRKGDLPLAKRFAREVEIMARVRHPNLIRILESHLSETPPLFSMPLADASIESKLIAGIDETEALSIFKCVCAAVEAIHALGAIHRDIKPANILQMSDGSILLSDLGLVKFDDTDTTTLTATTDFLGTLQYMAPEQLRPGGMKNATVAVDVYQLGKTLYQLLTGESPATIDLNAIAAPLASIISKATNQNPAERFQSVSLMLDSISRYERLKHGAHGATAEFEEVLADATKYLSGNHYTFSNLAALFKLLRDMASDQALFIKNFDRIPTDLLRLAAFEIPEITLELMREYVEKQRASAGNRAFEYAETVCKRMNSLLSDHFSTEIKVLALQASWTVSAILNRFAAMKAVDKMLEKISSEADAKAVARAMCLDQAHVAGISGSLHPERYHPLVASALAFIRPEPALFNSLDTSPAASA